MRLDRKQNISDTRNERNSCEHNLGLPSMLPLIACCIRRGSNRRRASLTTYLFLFSMITKIWSGFREPQKDHGNGEYLHFQFVWSFGLSIEVVCWFLSCFELFCVVLCCFMLFCVVLFCCWTELWLTLPVLLHVVSIQVRWKCAVDYPSKRWYLQGSPLKRVLI